MRGGAGEVPAARGGRGQSSSSRSVGGRGRSSRSRSTAVVICASLPLCQLEVEVEEREVLQEECLHLVRQLKNLVRRAQRRPLHLLREKVCCSLLLQHIIQQQTIAVTTRVKWNQEAAEGGLDADGRPLLPDDAEVLGRRAHHGRDDGAERVGGGGGRLGDLRGGRRRGGLCPPDELQHRGEAAPSLQQLLAALRQRVACCSWIAPLPIDLEVGERRISQLWICKEGRGRPGSELWWEDVV